MSTDNRQHTHTLFFNKWWVWCALVLLVSFIPAPGQSRSKNLQAITPRAVSSTVTTTDKQALLQRIEEMERHLSQTMNELALLKQQAVLLSKGE